MTATATATATVTATIAIAPPIPAEADEDSGPVEVSRLSPEAERYRAILVDSGTDPLTPSLRRAVIHAFVDEVKERTAASKRMNLQGATNGVARRTRPKVPTKAVGAILEALFRAGELIHADGNPVRSPSASFMVPKSEDALLLALQSYYLRVLLEEEKGEHDSRALAELLLGDAADAQDIEALMAWLVYEQDQQKAREEEAAAAPAVPDEDEAPAELEAAEPEPEPEAPAKKKRAPARKPRRRIAGRDEDATPRDPGPGE